MSLLLPDIAQLWMKHIYNLIYLSGDISSFIIKGLIWAGTSFYLSKWRLILLWKFGEISVLVQNCFTSIPDFKNLHEYFNTSLSKAIPCTPIGYVFMQMFIFLRFSFHALLPVFQSIPQIGHMAFTSTVESTILRKVTFV